MLENSQSSQQYNKLYGEEEEEESLSSIKMISSFEAYNGIYCLCNECITIPQLSFENNKIKWKCQYDNKNISYKDIFDSFITINGNINDNLKIECECGEEIVSYYCIECKIYLCNICMTYNQCSIKKHNLIDIISFLKNLKCYDHNEKFSYYCKSCNKNKCILCQSKCYILKPNNSN